jgi:hypothetical protein
VHHNDAKMPPKAKVAETKALNLHVQDHLEDLAVKLSVCQGPV